MNTQSSLPHPSTKKRFDGLHIALISIVAILVSVALTWWVITTYIFPTQFRPVTLSAKEEQVLERKIAQLDSYQTTPAARRGGRSQAPTQSQPPLTPEPYSEATATREIYFKERELNALLAKNTDLAHRLAIDLSDDLVSAKLLMPMDPDFPVLGGKTLKVNAGVELAYQAGKPIVVLRGVSIMGVPIPNAWLGGLKNIDLVQEFGGQAGFWQSFAAGVEHIKVEAGELKIKLKE